MIQASLADSVDGSNAVAVRADETEGRVRVVRDSNVMGLLTLQPDGHGGWLLEGEMMCSGLRLC